MVGGAGLDDERGEPSALRFLVTARFFAVLAETCGLAAVGALASVRLLPRHLPAGVWWTTMSPPSTGRPL